MTTNDALLEQATAVLKDNDRGTYTAPAPELYPHQWLWDSCFTAIGLRHLDIERAQAELLSLLAAQWKNGMLPHMLFMHGGRPAVRRGPWHSWLSPFAPDDASTSGITQPPVVAEAVARIGDKLPLEQRRAWFRQVWPQLVAYHTWLYRERDPQHEGLVVLVHPWESGMDNSPTWMAELHAHLLPGWIGALHTTHLDAILGWLRTDTRRLPAVQRMANIDALALSDAMLHLRRKVYDSEAILRRPQFAIQDLAFNCILIRANALLKKIAGAIHEDIPNDLDEQMMKAETALDRLWDPEAKQYRSRTFASPRLLPEQSCAALLPLYAGSISHDRAERLVTLLEDEHIFGTNCAVPSVPADSRWFSEVCYWQGPTWVNMNWLIIDGLQRYGFKDHAAALRDSTIDMVARVGCYEYFNPHTGAGLGAENFSWTAALAIDLLKS